VRARGAHLRHRQPGLIEREGRGKGLRAGHEAGGDQSPTCSRSCRSPAASTWTPCSRATSHVPARGSGSDAVRNGAAFAASNRDNVMPVPGGFEPGTGPSSPPWRPRAGGGRSASASRSCPLMQAAADVLGRDASDDGGSLRLGCRRRPQHRLGRRPRAHRRHQARRTAEPPPDYVLNTLAGLTAPLPDD